MDKVSNCGVLADDAGAAEGFEVTSYDHPDREKMIVRAAAAMGLTTAERFEDVPETVRRFFECFEYRQIIKPLVEADRINGASFSKLAIRYALSVRQIRQILCCTSRYIKT